MAGVDSAEDLAKRCGVPQETVQSWLDSGGENMLLREALVLRSVLHVRGDWLLTGNGSMMSIHQRRRLSDILRIAERVPPGKLDMWVNWGTNLIRD